MKKKLGTDSIKKQGVGWGGCNNFVKMDEFFFPFYFFTLRCQCKWHWFYRSNLESLFLKLVIPGPLK